jgi:hypothetical protein
MRLTGGACFQARENAQWNALRHTEKVGVCEPEQTDSFVSASSTSPHHISMDGELLRGKGLACWIAPHANGS